MSDQTASTLPFLRPDHPQITPLDLERLTIIEQTVDAIAIAIANIESGNWSNSPFFDHIFSVVYDQRIQEDFIYVINEDYPQPRSRHEKDLVLNFHQRLVTSIHYPIYRLINPINKIVNNYRIPFLFRD